jgi:hypothetical protein
MKVEIKDLFDANSVESALSFLFNATKEDRLGNTIKEVERVAYLSFIGAYDATIRRPDKTEYAEQMIDAIKVVRLCATGIESIGCLTYGQKVAAFNKVSLKTEVSLVFIWVASVTEYELNWGSRPDGYVLAIEPEDLQTLLKSDNGLHLCGNSTIFSKANEFYRRELTEDGRETMRKALAEGKRAIWIDKIDKLIKPVT